MNNNRGNNRRRGRGNNRQQGGGQQLNRIDSRARGNAPQLLEKYRKLAHDAHLNGDRVTEEYYLQFADHYFRVIADQRQRQEESRQPRGERWQEGGEGDRYETDSAGEYGDDYPASPYGQSDRRDREEAPRVEDREDRPERPERQERQERQERPERQEAPAEAPGSIYEPPENPFVRENRGPRGLKPRRPRRDSQGAEAEGHDEQPAAPSQLDLAVLPPSISPREDAGEPAPATEEKPKRRTTRRKPPADDALQAAS